LSPPEKFPEPGVGADAGTSELIEGNYEKGYLDLFFSGKEVKGEFVLREAGGGMWELEKRGRATKARGEAARVESFGAQAARQLGGVNFHSLSQAAPAFIKPMECKLVAALPEGKGWTYELKLDGYRVIAVKKGGAVQLLSRYGNGLTQRFAGIAAALRRASVPDAVLDGEVVALDEQGRPSFQELQNSGSTRRPIVYYVFDLLNYGGRDLQGLPLQRRREALQGIAQDFAEPVRLAPALDAGLPALLAEIRRRGLEGLVAKRADSLYEAGKRSGAWRKYRINQREEFAIGGYLPGRNFLDAVLVGRFEGKQLQFVKKVRNGFVRRTREQVWRTIEPLRSGRCPFVNLPEAGERRGAVTVSEMKRYVWVKPEVRCEVEFEEWTRGGRLRHAAFRQLV
jgi:bifunctional non-homologous end joining protein LigD